ACVRSLRWASPAHVDRVPVEAGFAHVGAAVRLVHNLKYRRSMSAGRVLAAAMASGVPADAAALVPVPRSLARRVAYGIDQAKVLADEVAVLTGLPVVDALAAPIWWRRQAGASRGDRHPVAFRSTRSLPYGAVLVDDVFTTGATALSAIAALGSPEMSVLVATSAGTMEPGTPSFPSQGGGVTRKRETVRVPLHAALPRFQAGSSKTGAVVSPRPSWPTYREELG
ncbi:MAG: hypothetical protein ABFR95_09105, partial [Actinomycetota bacterium]